MSSLKSSDFSDFSDSSDSSEFCNPSDSSESSDQVRLAHLWVDFRVIFNVSFSLTNAKETINR